MIRETVIEVINKYPTLKKIGLLATSGTIESKLYDVELEKNGLQITIPDNETQNEKVMRAVYGIKAGENRHISEDLLADAGQHLTDKGAELIILGCTEIPLAFNKNRIYVPIVDATRVLAERAIRMYFDIVTTQGMTYFQSGHDL
jgi:aspartate racemase